MALVALFFLCLVGGCSWFRGDTLERYRADNERLISEYRTERERSQRLEIENRALVGRVSDLEQRLTKISEAVQETPYRPAAVPLRSELPDVGSGPAGGRRDIQVPTGPLPDPWKPVGE